MRLLVVVNDPICTGGPIQERFVERGYAAEVHHIVTADQADDPNVEPNLPDLASYDALLVLGARWSVTDPEQTGRWLPTLLDQLRSADAAGVPVLGVCFGAQLLALAHGGSVHQAEQPELGWYTIETDRPDLVAEGPWFEWHYDTISVPSRATEIARSATASQAFVLGRNLAVQFHPEVDQEIFAVWMEHGAVAALSEIGLDGHEVAADITERDAEIRERAHALVDAFLDHMAGDQGCR